MKTDIFKGYLKPKGVESVTRKFREVPSVSPAHTSSYADSIIQKHNGEFDVVFKLHDNFAIPRGCKIATLLMVDMSSIKWRLPSIRPKQKQGLSLLLVHPFTFSGAMVIR